MSSKIDERVVELKFNTKQFEQGTKNVTDNLDKLNKSLSMDGMKNGLDGVQQSVGKFSFQNMSDGLSNLTSKFGALSVIGITAIANLTSRAIDAGLQIAKSLTIDPIMDGFSEYELKMGSVQTIMAGTGASLQEVSGYLEDLNRYADRTIYSFADMTSNIGKFTNAGVDLNTAVKAIQGISNVAAVSGANANEASRAMYNFSQALSAGHVKLIDWKSIEMANMATAEFKTELLDSAVAAGKLTKGVDGMYTTLKGTPVSATKGFNESLEEQWLTTEVLTSTLGRYSDETTEIGKKAFAAAQDVKTFSQMMDTLKEAVGSGWAQTFEIVIGDFDEAKKLWTNVNNVVGGFINSTSEMRNNLLQAWADMGGRTAAIDAISNAFNALVAILKPVAKAFAEVFPPITAEALYNATIALRDFTAGLVVSEKTSNRIQTVFKAVFSVLKGVGEILLGLGKIFMSVFGAAIRIVGSVLSLFTPFIDLFSEIDKKVNGAGGGFLTFADRISNLIDGGIQPLLTFLGNLRKALDDLIKSQFGGWVANLEQDFNPLATLGERVASIWSGIAEFLQVAWGKIQAVLGKFGEAMRKLGSGIGEAFSGFDFNLIFAAANTGVIAAVGIALTRLLNSGKGAVDSVSDLFKFKDAIADVFEGVTGTLKAMQNDLNASALLKLAGAIGILAVSMLILSTIDGGSIASSSAGMAAMVAMLVGATIAIEKFTTFTGAAKLPLIIASLIGLAGAILLMSISLKLLSTMSWDDIGRGLTVLAGAMIVMVGAMTLLSNVGLKATVAAAGMAIMANAILVLAIALKIMGTMSWEDIAQGLAVLAGAMIIMVIALQKLGDVGPKAIVAAAAMAIMSGALLTLSGVIRILGSMDMGQLAQGLIAMTIGLGVMIGALLILGKFAPQAVAASFAMLIMAAAIGVLTAAVYVLGSMDMGTLIQGLIGLTVALGILVGAVLLLGIAGPLALLGAGAMIIMAAAIAVMAAALLVLGTLPAEAIVQGLNAIASAIGLMVAAGLILGVLSPILISGAIALGALGVAMVVVGAGMLIFAIALGIFSGAAPGAATGLITLAAAIMTIAPFLPLLAVAGVVFIAFGAGALIAGVGILVLGAALIVLSAGMALIGITAPMGVVGLMLLTAAMSAIAPKALEMVAVGASFIVFGAGLLVLGAGALIAGAGLLVFGAGLKMMSSVGPKGAESLGKVVEKVAGLTGQAIALGIMSAALGALGVALLATGAGSIMSGAGLMVMVAALLMIMATYKGATTGLNLVGVAIVKLSGSIGLLMAFAAAMLALGVGFTMTANSGRTAANGINSLVTSSNSATGAVRNLSMTVMSMLPAAMNIFRQFGPTVQSSSTQVTTALMGLSRGVSSTIPATTVAATLLAVSLVSALVNGVAGRSGSVYSSGYNVGMAISQGMAAGVRGGSYLVQNAADRMAAEALAAAKARLGVRSPSREFGEVGMWSDKGMAGGLLRHIGVVTAASETVATAALNTMQDAMSGVGDFISSDMDLTPTIRPVMDLSSVRKDAGELRGILGSNAINTDQSYSNAASASNGFEEARVALADDSARVTNVTNLNYSQTNNSPEALSPTEVYRQTRNQLSTVKGVLKNVNQGPTS